MALFMEYDESYVAGHKASSITSIDSADYPPSLYTGHADSCSSLCDPDELREPPVFEDPSPYEPVKFSHRTSISIPLEEDLMPSSLYHGSSLNIPVTKNDKQQQEEQNSIPNGHNDDGTITYLPTEPLAWYKQRQQVQQEEQEHRAQQQQEEEDQEKETSSLVKIESPLSANSSGLSQDEKRANHIASEQKRRQNIRTGFQQLTDLIPTLKNMPHSKSTILFKTADYIKHSEKRNKMLQERLKQLQRRVALSKNALSSATPYYHHHHHHHIHKSSKALSSSKPLSLYSASSPISALASSSSRRPSSSNYSSTQLQILRLQQQLLQQQELLLQHKIPHHPLPPLSQQQPVYGLHHQHHQHHQPTAAIVMPACDTDDDEVDQQQQQQQQQQHTMHDIPVNSTPCLHIPADDDYHQESMHRERLLSCGKLKLK